MRARRRASRADAGCVVVPEDGRHRAGVPLVDLAGSDLGRRRRFVPEVLTSAPTLSTAPQTVPERALELRTESGILPERHHVPAIERFALRLRLAQNSVSIVGLTERRPDAGEPLLDLIGPDRGQRSPARAGRRRTDGFHEVVAVEIGVEAQVRRIADLLDELAQLRGERAGSTPPDGRSGAAATARARARPVACRAAR